MSDRGDEISDETKEFLLFQNAMADLDAKEPGLTWWGPIRRGFEEIHSPFARCVRIEWFREQALAGDPLAQALIIKVAELRTR